MHRSASGTEDRLASPGRQHEGAASFTVGADEVAVHSACRSAGGASRAWHLRRHLSNHKSAASGPHSPSTYETSPRGIVCGSSESWKSRHPLTRISHVARAKRT